MKQIIRSRGWLALYIILMKKKKNSDLGEWENLISREYNGPDWPEKGPVGSTVDRKFHAGAIF